MKKILLVLLAAGLIVVSTVACAGQGVTPAAGGDVGVVPLPDIIDPDEEDPGDLIIEDDGIDLPDQGGNNFDEAISEYFSITGIVVNMEERDGLRRIEIEDLDGNPAVLVLNDETVFPFSTDYAVGDEVTGWYLTNMPMIMIWPAEYSVDVLVSRMGDDRNIKADRFVTWEADTTEGFMISQDGMLAFKVDEDTEIILADGQDFQDGSLEGRRIVVIYGISTRSIPEQATADKLIVLFEGIVPVG